MAPRPGPYIHTLKFQILYITLPLHYFQSKPIETLKYEYIKEKPFTLLVIGPKYKPRKLAALRVFCIALSRLIRCAAQSAVPRMSDQGHTLFTVPPCALSSSRPNCYISRPMPF